MDNELMSDISTSVLTRRDPVRQISIKCLLGVGFWEDNDEKDTTLNSRSSVYKENGHEK